MRKTIHNNQLIYFYTLKRVRMGASTLGQGVGDDREDHRISKMRTIVTYLI